jgi:hypothetical protein
LEENETKQEKKTPEVTVSKQVSRSLDTSPPHKTKGSNSNKQSCPAGKLLRRRDYLSGCLSWCCAQDTTGSPTPDYIKRPSIKPSKPAPQLLEKVKLNGQGIVPIKPIKSAATQDAIAKFTNAIESFTKAELKALADKTKLIFEFDVADELGNARVLTLDLKSANPGLLFSAAARPNMKIKLSQETMDKLINSIFIQINI